MNETSQIYGSTPTGIPCCQAGMHKEQRNPTKRIKLLQYTLSICLLTGASAQAFVSESGAVTNVPSDRRSLKISQLSERSSALSSQIDTNGGVFLSSPSFLSGADMTVLAESTSSSPEAPHIIATNRVLNIDMAADPSYKRGSAAVGRDTTDFWNPYWRPGVSAPVQVQNLLWSDEQASGVNMTVANAPGGWGLGVNDSMYNSYCYSGNNQPLEVSFANLPAGNYDIFLYGHGPADYAGCVFQVNAGSRYVGRRGTGIWSASWAADPWEEGIQYVRFRQVQVGTGETLRILVEPDANGYAVLNGLQLVPSEIILEYPLRLSKLLNVNFGGGASPRTGQAAFGMSSTDFWDCYNQPGLASGQISALVWADGSATAGALTVQNAPGAWGFECGDVMYGNYIYPWQQGPISIALSSLPAGTYDLCFYAHTPTEDDNSVIELWKGGVLLDKRGTSLWGTHPATAEFQEGQQYVVFRNVTLQTGETLSALVQPGDAGYAIINGMQVFVPFDRDLDTLPDEWELSHFGTLSETADDDHDGDNLSNGGEYKYGSDPTNSYSFDPSNTVKDPVYLFTARLSNPAPPSMAKATYQDSGDNIIINISQGIPNRLYELYFVEEVYAAQWEWRRVFSSIRCNEAGAARVTFRKPNPTMGFFWLFDAADDDKDGIGNGYEVWFKYASGNPTSPDGKDRLDSDGDLMTDTWEIAYGTDPTLKNGSSDLDSDGISNFSEYRYNNAFQNPIYDPLKNHLTETVRPVVWISTADSTASFPGNQANFKLHRTGNLNSALTVYYVVGGEAQYLTDYVLNPVPSEFPRVFSATIPAGTDNVQVTVTPLVAPATGTDAREISIQISPYASSASPRVQSATLWQYVVDLNLDKVTLRLNNEVPGFNGPVYSVKLYKTRVIVNGACVEHQQLYVGGSFTQAGAVQAQNIAKFNSSTRSWEPLGAGVNGPVYSIEAVQKFDGDTNPDVYVGGRFSSPALGIAQWNGLEWAGLGTGINSAPFVDKMVRVNVIKKAPDDSLWVGGRFSNAGGAFRPNLARWANQQWTTLVQNVYSFGSASPISSSGLNSQLIMVTAIDPSGLAVATARNGTTCAYCPVSSMDFEAFYSAVGNGTALDLYGQNRSALLAGMHAVSGTLAGHKDPELSFAYQPFEADAGNYSGLSELTDSGWHLLGYAGAALPPLGNSPYYPVASQIESGWKLLGSVYAIANHEGSYYFGGSFDTLMGANAGSRVSSHTGFNNIFKWDSLSRSWSKLANSAGVNCVIPAASGVNGTIHAIELDYSLCSQGLSGIWVGGNFTKAGGGSAWGIAYWAIDAANPQNTRYYWAAPEAPTIQAPQAGSVFTAPANVSVIAGFSATGCTPVKVDFYEENQLLASRTSSPYSFTWNQVPLGRHTVRAIARYPDGRPAVSESVSFTVQ